MPAETTRLEESRAIQGWYGYHECDKEGQGLQFPDTASWTSGGLLTDEASPVLCVPSLPVQQLVRSK